MNDHFITLVLAVLAGTATLSAQDRPSASTHLPSPAVRGTQSGLQGVGGRPSDIVVVRDAQEQALEQVRSMKEDGEGSRDQAALDSALKEMERSLALLDEAEKTSEKLPEALAAEQTAYQALLKLAAHEYQVSRSNNGQQGGQQGERSMRQLDQLELKQSDNRYETQRQASSQQEGAQREQLQVLNRLKELAQRQQDLNQRLKELQTALQEAKTDEEREEINRRLKRLREEERQMLGDMDEAGQRMNREENQSRMADARQQLEKARAEVQRAAEALDDKSVPQALASGTRAQRGLQQMSDDLRKKSSGQFSEEMRQMRDDARQLGQKQEELAKQLDSLADAKRKTLNDSEERKGLANELVQQKTAITNLFNEMRRVSEQSETAEPLLSKQLYDTLRKADQGATDKSLDLSSELIQRGFLSQAGQFEQRARRSIDDLKQGVERAAQSVLGDDTEALRLARREIDSLSGQLAKEMAQAGSQSAAASTNAQEGISKEERQRPESSNSSKLTAPNGKPSQSSHATDGKNSSSEQSEADSPAQAQNGSPTSLGREKNSQTQAGQDSAQNGGSRSSTGSPSEDGQNTPGRGVRRNFYDQGGSAEGGGGEGGDFAGGPLTGDNFVNWSDRLRDVEEVLDAPELRSEVARVRDRARAMRTEYRQHGVKPDWAVVRLQIAEPLAEVRSRIGEELARRESTEAIVPIDRDPVPAQFSELVRRYYERLGKSE